ncbi:hypothetical protein N7490_008090 [Penicillium lividum]|nr:hypothetical protein N7490_008090 [Penicillium lividum]
MASQRAQTGRPALVPNGLPLPDPSFGNYQRQDRDSAKTVDQLEAASKSPPEEFQGLSIEPRIRPKTSSEKDVCTSAARSTLGPNSTNQTRSNVIEPAPVYWHPSQKPPPIPTAPVSSVLGSTVQTPMNYANQGIQKDTLVTSNMLHKPAPGSQKAAPVAHSKSRLSSMEGQEPPNKMRKIQDGSKQSSGPNTEEDMLPRKQTKSSIARRLGRLDLVEPLDVNEMDVKKKYDATTIARDVLIAAAKHPTEKGLNNHLLILKDSIPSLDYSADLATLRWDLLDPLLSSRDKSTYTRPPIQPINATGATVVSSHLNPLSSGPSSLPSNALPLTSYPLKSGSPPSPPLSQPSRPIPTPEPAPSNSELPAKNPNIGSRSPSRSKIAAQGSVVPAKSPRTKQSLQPAVVVHSSPQKMQTMKKRGRPRKDDVDKTTIDRILTPTEAVEYPVYKCHWEKCQAELHTLVLLQRHVLKAHVPHNLTCGWHGCENTTHMAASTLWEHMRDTHVKDYAWNLGDGPVVPSPGEDDVDKTPKLPHFNLFDRHARPGTLILPADRDLVEIFNRSRGISNSKQKAEAFIDGACRWKEEVGPDVDISDRRLSTPPRQISSQLTEIAYTLPGAV